MLSDIGGPVVDAQPGEASGQCAPKLAIAEVGEGPVLAVAGGEGAAGDEVAAGELGAANSGEQRG
ncbi:hypothetical protein [Streptomyces sp. LRE541]|uniref:hypothetical protein n=1 Tax=Streptomyces sp. LRE541 TaxID=2931983 RepID=UPI0032C3F0ED